MCTSANISILNISFRDIHIFLDNWDQIKSLFPPKLPAKLSRNDPASFCTRQNKDNISFFSSVPSSLPPPNKKKLERRKRRGGDGGQEGALVLLLCVRTGSQAVLVQYRAALAHILYIEVLLFRLTWNRVKWVGRLDNPRSLPLIFFYDTRPAGCLVIDSQRKSNKESVLDEVFLLRKLSHTVGRLPNVPR